MKSTGEVMGFDADFGRAFAKAQAAAFGSLPTEGRVFVSMANRDKRSMIFPIKVLADLGFEILATQGTADVLRRNGVRATVVRKHFDGPGPAGEPTTVQLIAEGEVALVVNTPHGSSGSGGSLRALRDGSSLASSGTNASSLGSSVQAVRVDGYEIRTAAVRANVPCITTVQGLGAAVQGIEARIRGDIGVRSLQDWSAETRAAARPFETVAAQPPQEP
jgi:carbamoyl-phosphate synthase large subunit